MYENKHKLVFENKYKLVRFLPLGQANYTAVLNSISSGWTPCLRGRSCKLKCRSGCWIYSRGWIWTELEQRKVHGQFTHFISCLVDDVKFIWGWGLPVNSPWQILPPLHLSAYLSVGMFLSPPSPSLFLSRSLSLHKKHYPPGNHHGSHLYKCPVSRS